jgi:hypothetical protein
MNESPTPAANRCRVQTNPVRSLQASAKLVVTAAILVLFTSVLIARQAHAGQILEETGLFVGQTSAQYSLNVSSAGTLSLNLIDYAWPSPLSDLTLQIASPTQILGQMSGAGIDSLALSGPGTYYAYVTGSATGSLDLGAYGLIADFQATPVPLPASISLLLGGIAATLWSMRRKGRAVPDDGLFGASASG